MDERILALVRAQACVLFVSDHEAPAGICAACGWLLHDHEATGSAADAAVKARAA